jgi:eukaryotic-like serine/threonine-protein kinase
MLDQALAGTRLAATIQDERLLAELPYRAPEQIEPGAALDARTALYAIGAVLYFVMTGQPPFAGPTPDAIVQKIREGKVLKPSKHIPEMPPPFEAAVLKLLARRPENRYQSAAEMLAAVEPIAVGHEIKA